jgi:hypothetical protein
MLFHVTHTHTWDACPYNQPEKVRATFGAALAGVAATGATLVGAWVDAPAHKVFLVIEAESARQIEEALAPIIPIGHAKTRPVVDAADVIARKASSE